VGPMSNYSFSLCLCSLYSVDRRYTLFGYSGECYKWRKSTTDMYPEKVSRISDELIMKSVVERVFSVKEVS
jgi:hypothetical protein